MIMLELSQVCISKNKCRRTPHSLNNSLHWREKMAWTKAWKEMVGWMARGKCTEPFERARVKIELRHTRLFDHDNAYGSVKSLVDGLKGIVIMDDAPDKIDLKVEQVKVAHYHEEKVVIHVEEI